MRIVETAGGRVDGRTEYAPTDNDQGSATLQLRIPADKLTATLDKLEELGRADEVSLSTSDVTVQSQDLDARITALRASIERLNGLMAQATNIDDLITLESAISSRQGELESLEAQQRYLADQVVDVDDLAVPALRRRGAEDRCRATSGRVSRPAGTRSSAFWAGLLVVLGVLLPWLITLARDRGPHHLDRAAPPPGRHRIPHPAAAERHAAGDRCTGSGQRAQERQQGQAVGLGRIVADDTRLLAVDPRGHDV